MKCIKVNVVACNGIIATYNQNAVKPLPRKGEMLAVDETVYRVRNVLHKVTLPGTHCESRTVFLITTPLTVDVDGKADVATAEALGFNSAPEDVLIE